MALPRKIVNTLLALLLLMSTTGITLSQHYCMGRLKSAAIFTHAEHCSSNQERDPMPCCQDVESELKVEDLSKVSFAYDFQPVLVSFFTLPTLQDFLLDMKPQEIPTENLNLPPPDDLLVLHQVFRI